MTYNVEFYASTVWLVYKIKIEVFKHLTQSFDCIEDLTRLFFLRVKNVSKFKSA